MDNCTILLICDDDLGAHELRSALGDWMTVSPALSRLPPRRISITWQQAILSGAWSLDLGATAYDLCILAVAGEGAGAFLASNPVLCESSRALLVVLDPEARFTPPPTHGAIRILAKPLTASALLRATERLLLSALARRAPALTPVELLPFVRNRLAAGEPRIEPLLDPDADAEGSVVYPDIVENFGLGVDAEALLESMVEAGAAERKIAHRLRGCARCAGTRVAYGEACVRCGSVDFAREAVIHHFACAAVDVVTRFQRDGDLVCPKCNERLRQIGQDYEKPLEHCHCHGCGLIAPDARVVARCWSCRHTSAPQETVERLVYAYEISADAEVALQPPSPAHGLFTSEGLSPRALFLFEANREFARFRRHHQEFTILMARLHGLAASRQADPALAAARVERLERALVGKLRTLDVACAWDDGVVALLLPATGAAGAGTVADRVERTLAQSADAADAGVTVAVATAHEAFVNLQAMIDACQRGLDPSGTHPVLPGSTPPGKSPSGDFVVIDDDSAGFRNSPSGTFRPHPSAVFLHRRDP